eukprot:5894131-Pleurochrysis_carterae.AAC.2
MYRYAHHDYDPFLYNIGLLSDSCPYRGCCDARRRGDRRRQRDRVDDSARDISPRTMIFAGSTTRERRESSGENNRLSYLADL